MGTQYSDLFGALMVPFQEREVKVRDAPGGRKLHYITARTAMNRLDEVLGPENWWDHYIPGENSVVCILTIRLPDGSLLTKEDAGGMAGMADAGDDDMSGFSSALKRAAAKFGVGRYLYRDGVPSFALAAAASSHPYPSAPDHNMHGAASDAPPPRSYNDPPRSGKALFAWSRQVEDAHDVAMVKYLQNWGKVQEFPARMIDWDGDQVARAYEEGARKLAAVQGPATSPPEDPEALRRALKRMISSIARAETGREEIAAPDCIRTVARLDALVPESLRIPGEIDACADPARLRAYIDAATRRHAALRAQSESAA